MTAPTTPLLTLYFAAPLFSAAERRFNLALTEKLETSGFSVFLPQRDGVERDRPPFDTMPADEKRQRLFETDRDQIFSAEVFLFVLDGRVPDEGACVELGLAYAHTYLSGKRKLLVGLQTDVRAAFIGAKLNPMLSVPLDHVADSEYALIAFLRSTYAAQS